jgi:hypothetical protein
MGACDLVRTTTIHCNRCGAIVLEGMSVLEAKHGRLSRQFDDALDLCEGCGESFVSWLKSGRQTGFPTMGTAPVGVVHQLDEVFR